MNVKVTIKLDSDKLNNITKAHIKSLEMATEALKSDIVTSAVIPKDTGELERSCFINLENINNGITNISFDTPYARRLYWHPEYNFRTDKNVNAQGKWMDAYINGDKDDFIKNAYSRFLKMNSKGVIK